jgi:hypothetical protein
MAFDLGRPLALDSVVVFTLFLDFILKRAEGPSCVYKGKTRVLVTRVQRFFSF